MLPRGIILSLWQEALVQPFLQRTYVGVPSGVRETASRRDTRIPGLVPYMEGTLVSSIGRFDETRLVIWPISNLFSSTKLTKCQN